MTQKFSLPKYWRMPSLVLLGLVTLSLYSFWSGYQSMVDVWLRSETFTHGFAILPISLYLIFRERFKLYRIAPKASVLGGLMCCGAVLLWWLGHLVDVLLVQHFAQVILLPLLCLTCFGWSFVRQFWFPLLYLLFMVPAGEGLIPILQDVTAYMSVKGIQWVGIPVFWQGYSIEIPSGNFTVAEACSGMRYLIASVAVGVLYAYLTYQKWHKRLLMAIASVVVPIIANGIRAWGIIMLAHYSDYSLAVGFDHLIYGWAFFGVVIFVMFWIGSFWADTEPSHDRVELIARCHHDSYDYWLKVALLMVLVLQLPLLGNWGLQRLNQSPADFQLATLQDEVYQPVELGAVPWQPQFLGASQQHMSHYQLQQQLYDVYIGGYVQQQQHQELINTQNSIYDLSFGLHVSSSMQQVNGQWLEERVYQREGATFVVWYWYWIAGHKTTSEIKGKLFELVGQLQGRPQTAVVAVRAAMADDYEVTQTRQRMSAFMQRMEPKITQQLAKMY